MEVDVYDPFVNNDELFDEYGFKTINKLSKYDCIILAVPHQNFKTLDIVSLKREKKSVIYDVKSFLDVKIINSRL